MRLERLMKKVGGGGGCVAAYAALMGAGRSVMAAGGALRLAHSFLLVAARGEEVPSCHADAASWSPNVRGGAKKKGRKEGGDGGIGNRKGKDVVLGEAGGVGGWGGTADFASVSVETVSCVCVCGFLE